MPNHRKNIDRVCMAFALNKGYPVSVNLLSDCGECSEQIVLSGSEEQMSAAYIRSVVLCPRINSILRIGAKVECKGYMAVDSIGFYYRKLGFAR